MEMSSKESPGSGLEVSSSPTIHYDNQRQTDVNDAHTCNLLQSILALAPIITMDFTLFLSGIISRGSSSQEADLDAAEQMPVSLDADLANVGDGDLPGDAHCDEFIYLKAGGNAPSTVSVLVIKEIFKSDESRRTGFVYLTRDLNAKCKTHSGENGGSRAVTPPDIGGGDKLNWFSLNNSTWVVSGRQTWTDDIKAGSNKEAAGRYSHKGCQIGQFLAATFWHSQTGRLRAFAIESCSANRNDREGEDTTQSRRSKMRHMLF